MPEDHKIHRDEKCAQDVGQMMLLRRFEQEFLAYGTVQWEVGKAPRYLATMNADKLFQYRADAEVKGMYFTPITTYIKRTLVPSGMDEIVTQATKHLLLGQLKEDFAQTEWMEQMTPFFETQPNDAAYGMLKAEQDRIDGYFDDKMLQLFEGFLMEAFYGKNISDDHFKELRHWLHWTRRQMEDNPITGDLYKRTFYGFVYEENGIKNTIVDAKRDTVLQRREALLQKGIKAAPLLQKVYFFSKFTMIKDIRKAFKEWILADADDYLQMIHALRALPTVIDQAALQQVKASFAEGSAAENAVAYYQTIWNCQ